MPSCRATARTARPCGEARAAADLVSNERLSSVSGLEFIIIELDKLFGPYETLEVPDAVETAFYGPMRDVRSENFTQYTRRKRHEFEPLQRKEVQIPELVRGYIILRYSELTEAQYDKVVIWTEATYAEDRVVLALNRLDRPDRKVGTAAPGGRS
mgnify:CR=1 FL=1